MSPLPEQSPQPSKPAESAAQSSAELEASPSPETLPADDASDASDNHASEEAPVLKRPVMRPVRPQPPADSAAAQKAATSPAATPSTAAKPQPAKSMALQSKPVGTTVSSTPAAAPIAATPALTTQTEGLLRNQPIPPPSEPKQYRAIGLLRGCYTPSDEQFTRGDLKTADGTSVEAVLLGRVMSLVKNHLDLQQDHLWVVYPRTRTAENLHVQIVGVWEPEKLQKKEDDEDVAEEPADSDDATPGFEDDYFSVRGEVVFNAPEEENVVVKIQQTPRKDTQKAKAFKLQLKGVLPSEKSVGYFWDFQVKRDANALVIVAGSSVGLVPPRKKKPGEESGFKKRRPPGNKRFGVPGGKGKPTGVTPGPRRESPLPKPAKRSSESSGESSS